MVTMETRESENTRAQEDKIKITDKKCLDREQYGKKLKEIVENKEKLKCTLWSKR